MYIFSWVHRRQPGGCSQKLYADPLGVQGIELLPEGADSELLGCPGDRSGYWDPANAMIAIRISIYHRLEFDMPKCEDTVDGDVRLLSADSFAERRLKGQVEEHDHGIWESVGTRRGDEGQA